MAAEGTRGTAAAAAQASPFLPSSTSCILGSCTVVSAAAHTCTPVSPQLALACQGRLNMPHVYDKTALQPASLSSSRQNICMQCS